MIEKKLDKEAIYSIARANMVTNQLIPVGVTDHNILQAISSTPKHLFVDKHWEEVAYSDGEIHVNESRKLMRTEVFAKILNLANIKRERSRILDVGCCSGYSSAVLGMLSLSVVGIDNDDDLLSRAKNYINNILNLKNISLFPSEQVLGNSTYDRSFDIIIINGSVHYDYILNHSALFNCLALDGCLLTIEQKNNCMKIVKYSNDRNSIIRKEMGDAYAPPLSILG